MTCSRRFALVVVVVEQQQVTSIWRGCRDCWHSSCGERLAGARNDDFGKKSLWTVRPRERATPSAIGMRVWAVWRYLRGPNQRSQARTTDPLISRPTPQPRGHHRGVALFFDHGFHGLHGWEPLSPALSPQAGRERTRGHDMFTFLGQINIGRRRILSRTRRGWEQLGATSVGGNEAILGKCHGSTESRPTTRELAYRKVVVARCVRGDFGGALRR